SVGFMAGVGGIATVQRKLRRSRPVIAGGESLAVMSTEEAADQCRFGVHNFAEGLAIGVSAQAGEIGLATVLIIGLALHNATEGFGIVGPLGDVRPSWRWLIGAGLVAGGPTFVGAMVGYQVTSDALEL